MRRLLYLVLLQLQEAIQSCLSKCSTALMEKLCSIWGSSITMDGLNLTCPWSIFFFSITPVPLQMCKQCNVPGKLNYWLLISFAVSRTSCYVRMLGLSDCNDKKKKKKYTLQTQHGENFKTFCIKNFSSCETHKNYIKSTRKPYRNIFCEDNYGTHDHPFTYLEFNDKYNGYETIKG